MATNIQNQFSENKLFDTWIDSLKKKLKQPLPGEEAQFMMAPATRKLIQTPSVAIPSSVLILLYPYQDEVYTVVMQRPDYDGAHSGQISLPGGKYEQNDMSMLDTALREAFEEIGVNRDDINIIGELTPLYIPPSNFIVYPFIGYMPSRPEFFADPSEVREIIEFRLQVLSQKECRTNRMLHLRNSMKIEAPGFLVNEHFIWGATAMIFSELMSVLEKK